MAGAALRAVFFAAGSTLGVLVALPAHADPMSTSPEQAWNMGELPGARATAMGGALNALGVSTTALSLNPANMTLARVYHLEAFGALSPEAQRQTYGLAIVDSMVNSSRLAGGIEGAASSLDPGGLHRTWTDVRAALAIPLGDLITVGATGRWLHVSQSSGQGPFGSDYVSGGTSSGPIENLITFDAGATAVLGGLRLGLVGHNLTNPGTALAPTTAAAGIGYQTDIFAIEADGMLDFTTWSSTQGRVMGGAELFVEDHYAIRGGWSYSTGTGLHTPSLGFGYIDPRWSIEGAVNHDIASSHASTLFVLSLRYFYDATGATSPADAPDAL
jgi:hypothetical protein